MIEIGTTQIKNRVDEFTLHEFQTITSILADESLDKIEQWVKVFVFLGADENEVDGLDFSEFKEYVKQWNENQPNLDNSFLKSFDLNGYTYQAYDEEFKLNVKDLKHIEKIIKQKPSAYILDVMAIIFKRTDLSSAEHYTESHLKHKAKLFKDLDASICIPYVNYIGQKISNTATQLDAVTEIME